MKFIDAGGEVERRKSMEEKFKVTIEFSAIDYNKALETYNMMLEAFCNNTDFGFHLVSMKLERHHSEFNR